MSGNVKDSVRDKVVAILAEQSLIEPGAVRMEATLEELGIDSLGLVETIFSIEEAFDIQVPFNANEPRESDFDVSSVASIVDAVEKLIATKH
ncbi:acyl carrier protein [Amaricoccus sp.]|uniref:acyl carrier protein n=1 Tax=Amaricoccus sp. TaxID=1872485 RepID=UPI00262CDB52|nr:acyl carrier protein [uncultured Amaricoccus sp.]